MCLIPASLQAYAARGPSWAAWLDRLPGVVRGLLSEWQLTADGAPTHGHTALVVPVRTRDGVAAVLKVGWPHPEAEHEALALQTWGGRGAVRLLRADPHRWALLLERLDRTDLTDHWDLQACEIVAGLYPRLHLPAPPQLRLLSAVVEEETDGLVERARELAVPRRMVEQAASLARDLVADPATDGRLLHTDLHFENVLAGPDGEWLAIDPKPLSGDPHYEIAPMLWNRWSDYAGRVRDGVRDRFFALVDGAGLDEDRARAWVVLRAVLNLVGELSVGTADRDWVTAQLALAKAVQE